MMTDPLIDISPLEYLTNLDILVLLGNQINDILPLVNNNGLSNGDIVNLSGNPLSATSITVYIPMTCPPKTVPVIIS
jgi:Leucine-rich repeat (LRR) protein